MSLDVETGTGSATAESYASVADADTRLSALGLTNWATLSTAEKEEALRRATVHMIRAYRNRWRGTRINSTQALDWPRYEVCVDGYPVDSDIVPADIRNACIDLALKAAAGDLAPDIERAVIREKVGPIETEYSAHAHQATQYRAIDMMLAPYLKGSSAMMRLVRA
ncbi:hypothetical protein BSL82_01270 [Tardibacter chloracetimidivorans]|uniref:Putative DnaT-like domain-containing protein n=1 Tax=Tardibacter chloracetimidivorans TaxID=1921510 RepID=A0A1L3ZR42_9SPHN|nr:DnaT-like ssDNA-binding protein [Tardibacter chloracetimidivorans]API58094.1 hypothetical protein BSL82_01270 [Tardibacter chloracetimidivorans]